MDLLNDNQVGVMEFTEERRRHMRYCLGDGAVAVFGNSPGRIADISLGGLSFIYLDSGRPRPVSDTVDILDGQQGFFLGKISCRTILDCPVIDNLPYKLIKRRLEFIELSAAQKLQIASYIHKQTVSLVSN
jgi:hypothetical protein